MTYRPPVPQNLLDMVVPTTAKTLTPFTPSSSFLLGPMYCYNSNHIFHHIFHQIPTQFQLQNTLCLQKYNYIQGDSGGICTTLGYDSMSDSKQKSSYEHGSDFERLRSYDRLKFILC